MRDVFETAIRLSSNRSGDFVELAKCLHALHERDAVWIKKFVQKSGTGFRHAYYLVEIGGRLEGLGLPRSRLEKIGWTKFQVIADQLNERNAEKLLRLAEKNTTRRLRALMRDETPLVKTHCVLLYFSPRQYKQFEIAVRQFGGRKSGRGLINKEGAVSRIVKTALANVASR